MKTLHSQLSLTQWSLTPSTTDITVILLFGGLCCLGKLSCPVSLTTITDNFPGLALCFLTFPLKSVSVASDESLQSSELDLQARSEANDTQVVEDRNKHFAVEETVIINEIVEFINTKYQSQSKSNRQQVGAESVFYCPEGCFVLDKNTSCYHKHLST